MHRYVFRFIFFIFFLTGCTVKPIPIEKSKINSLAYLLHTLNKEIPIEKATVLSRDILYKTKVLSSEFELTSPPLWHNFLVNTGLRPKGLCYHWSDTLYLHLKKQRYIHFSFHLVGADIGSYFLEHNALVVTNKNGKVENGVLIDPWRNSGNLYYSKVKDDHKYIWKHRLDRGCQ